MDKAVLLHSTRLALQATCTLDQTEFGGWSTRITQRTRRFHLFLRSHKHTLEEGPQAQFFDAIRTASGDDANLDPPPASSSR
jgi:hypothetical protein